jgi:histidinol phosphatase-like PHP family hydrolase
MPTRTSGQKLLANADISELLASAAVEAKQPLQKALRRAARKALFWPDEAAELSSQGKSLEDLPGVGPSLSRIIRRWIEDPPEIPKRPELRKNFLTRTEAQAVLSKRPSWLRELKGDLQMHSTWSDGSGTIQEMAEAADARGYEYIAITDHSKGLSIAGGINEDQLREQSEEIRALNRRFAAEGRAICVLRSIELNLDPRGQGDMDEAALSELDLVLGSFHSALRRKDDQTERYVAALRNPALHILGHPRGRIYNFRLGLQANWSRVFDTAAELDKAVEIDSYPDRQDLSPDLLAIAKRSGCRIAIDTDAHGPSQLSFIEYGLASAIRAGIPRERIINFLPADELLGWAQNLPRR